MRVVVIGLRHNSCRFSAKLSISIDNGFLKNRGKDRHFFANDKIMALIISLFRSAILPKSASVKQFTQMLNIANKHVLEHVFCRFASFLG